MALPQFRLKSMLGLVALLTVAMVLVPAVYRLVSLDWLDDAYALWGAGDMVVTYMQEHGDRWPEGWEDLKPYFDAGGRRVGGWSFEQYKQRVAIRWDVDPESLKAIARANPAPTFRAITARQWLAGTIGGHEPNEILYRYLRGNGPL
jgi:hypothetical protein